MRYLVGFMEGSEQLRGIKARVADVTRGLMCVAELVDSGHRLVFDKDMGVDISHMVNKASNVVVPVNRRNNTYETNWTVLPYQRAKHIQSLSAAPNGVGSPQQ